MGRKVRRIEDRIQNQHRCKHGRVEQIARQQDPQEADKVSQNSHLHLANESVFTSNILLEKTQAPQLLKMMRRNARTAEIESALHGSYSDSLVLAQAQDMPVDPKSETFEL